MQECYYLELTREEFERIHRNTEKRLLAEKAMFIKMIPTFNTPNFSKQKEKIIC